MDKYKNYKIGVCIAVYDHIAPVVYSNHISVLADWNRNLCQIMTFVVGYMNTADARNGVVEAALEQNCSHMLLLDSSRIIPGNMLALLLDTDFDIVSGLTSKPVAPFEQSCGSLDNKGDLQNADLPQDNKIHKVSFCTLGCALIKSHVFSLVGRPYFLDSSHELGHMRIRQNKSHAKNFQETALTKGVSIGVHTGVIVGRIGRPFVITPDNNHPKGWGKITIT